MKSSLRLGWSDGHHCPCFCVDIKFKSEYISSVFLCFHSSNLNDIKSAESNWLYGNPAPPPGSQCWLRQETTECLEIGSWGSLLGLLGLESGRGGFCLNLFFKWVVHTICKERGQSIFWSCIKLVRFTIMFLPLFFISKSTIVSPQLIS